MVQWHLLLRPVELLAALYSKAAGLDPAGFFLYKSFSHDQEILGPLQTAQAFWGKASILLGNGHFSTSLTSVTHTKNRK